MEEFDRTREMLRALRLEAEARRTIEGGERTELLGGRRLDSAEDTHTYTFLPRARARRAFFQVGEAVHVVADDVEASGVINRFGENGRIEIALRTDLGVTVPVAVLVQDDSYLLEALRTQLRSARRRTIEFNWSLADELFDPEVWTTDRTAPGEGRTDGRSLNREQAQAVACMNQPGVSVIWGPPGTGKTRTLAAGVRRARQRGRRVFLFAHTNVAVDNLLGRVLHELGDDKDVAAGRVVRVGELSGEGVSHDLTEHIAFRSIVRTRREPLEREFDRLGRAIGHIRSVLHSGAITAEERAAAETQLERLGAEAAAVEREHDRVPAVVLEEATVVATTIHRAHLPGNLRGCADMVVIDEASVVPLPLATYVAGLARESVVFAGDPRQSGVIVKSREPAVQRWVAGTVFDVRSESGAKATPLLLRRQYRMHPENAALVNHISYRDGALITPECVAMRQAPLFGLIEVGATLVDTSELRPRAATIRGTNTRVNQTHASHIVHLLTAILERTPGTPAAVITPYWGQARHIQRALPAELRHWVTVDTVHRFQGSERPLVIFDLPDSPGATLGRFMQARRTSEDGGRLLTVGLSRAHFALVVVANCDFLLNSAPPDALVQRLLKYLLANAPVLSTDGRKHQVVGNQPLSSR